MAKIDRKELLKKLPEKYLKEYEIIVNTEKSILKDRYIYYRKMREQAAAYKKYDKERDEEIERMFRELYNKIKEIEK